MKKFVISFYFYAFLIGLQSCTKDADINLPDVDPKLVISSFISPQDSLLEVAVSLSKPFYNNSNVNSKYEPLLNANVKIENGSNSYKLIYNAKLQRYIIDSFQLKVIPGYSYKLIVSGSDGKFATGNTVVPFANHSLKHSVTKDPTKENKYGLHCEWQDPMNEINYYLISSNYTSYYLSYHSSSIDGSSVDTIKCWRGATKYFNDTENDGVSFNFNSNFEYRNGMNDTVYITLATVAKEYLSYYEKLTKATVETDPFSEPIQMYTNINNGLGIFTAINKYRIRIFP